MTNNSTDILLLGQKFKALTLKDSFIRSSIMDYVNSLPSIERANLKEEIEYNSDLYQEFSSKLYNFFSIYFIENQPDANNEYQKIIESIQTNNEYIKKMYKYHADGHMTPLAQMIQNNTIPFIPSIVPKTILTLELLEDLNNQPKLVKTIKI